MYVAKRKERKKYFKTDADKYASGGREKRKREGENYDKTNKKKKKKYNEMKCIPVETRD